MKYRPEIDGLRALAVLPVIFFHAGFELFRGGFVGVDVFFVISGYLITTILLEDIESKRFRIPRFYERRARRILPALFLVLLTTIPFAWMWMLPSQLDQFAQSLTAVSLFASNFLFWRESGYFDSAVYEKPLLHTWSLAVEEQFYFLFPIFLILVWRFGRKAVFWAIVAVAATSFLLSEWGWRNNEWGNYYLAPTRAWELLAGSIAAFLVAESGVKKNNLLSLVGLASIVFSVFFYDENTPFPSAYTLVPVLGAVLVVVCGKGIVAKLLSAKALVGLGLVSYSAYLWHQPLFAFARIRNVNEPSNLVFLILSVLSIALGYLSWRWVERPFRNREIISSKTIFTISGIGIGLFVGIGMVLSNAGLNSFNTQQQLIVSEGKTNLEIMKNSAYDRYGCFFDQSQDAKQLIEKECVKNSNNSRLIIFGDSEAAHLYEGMQSEFPNKDVMQFTGASCRAIAYRDISDRCQEFYSLFVTEVIPDLKSNDMVVVSSNWWATYEKVGHAEFSASLRDILTLIRARTDNVIVFTNAPGFQKNPYEVLASSPSLMANKEVFLPTQNISSSDLAITAVGAELDVRVFNLSSILCKPDGACLFKNQENYLYFDTGHFSYFGSKYVATRFREFLYGE